jgi:hypothetical protein
MKALAFVALGINPDLVIPNKQLSVRRAVAHYESGESSARGKRYGVKGFREKFNFPIHSRLLSTLPKNSTIYYGKATVTPTD